MEATKSQEHSKHNETGTEGQDSFGVLQQTGTEEGMEVKDQNSVHH